MRAVASVTLAATTGTAGSFGVTVARPIAAWTIAQSGTGVPSDFISGIPAAREILAGTCFALMFFAVSTVAPDSWLSYTMVEA